MKTPGSKNIRIKTPDFENIRAKTPDFENIRAELVILANFKVFTSVGYSVSLNQMFLIILYCNPFLQNDTSVYFDKKSL